MSYYIHIQSYKPIPGDKQAKTADGLFGTPYEAVMHTVHEEEQYDEEADENDWEEEDYY